MQSIKNQPTEKEIYGTLREVWQMRYFLLLH